VFDDSDHVRFGQITVDQMLDYQTWIIRPLHFEEQKNSKEAKDQCEYMAKHAIQFMPLNSPDIGN